MSAVLSTSLSDRCSLDICEWALFVQTVDVLTKTKKFGWLYVLPALTCSTCSHLLTCTHHLPAIIFGMITIESSVCYMNTHYMQQTYGTIDQTLLSCLLRDMRFYTRIILKMDFANAQISYISLTKFRHNTQVLWYHYMVQILCSESTCHNYIRISLPLLNL